MTRRQVPAERQSLDRSLLSHAVRYPAHPIGEVWLTPSDTAKTFGGTLPGPEDTPAEQLKVLWEELCDILGTPATATVIRRAAGRAEHRVPDLKELRIAREQFQYHYAAPASWSTDSPIGAEGFRELTRELRPLLVELTGGVVLHRLREVASLRGSELFRAEDQ